MINSIFILSLIFFILYFKYPRECKILTSNDYTCFRVYKYTGYVITPLLIKHKYVSIDNTIYKINYRTINENCYNLIKAKSYFNYYKIY